MIEHIVSNDGLVHDAARLKELQALSWQRKVQITQARIIEFVERMGGVDNVCVSVSGKDSTVLLHIARQIYPTIQAVYVDTGLEYPEVRQLARRNGVEIIRPKMTFTEVLREYGYPIVGKEVADAIYFARKIRGGQSVPGKRNELMGVFDAGDYRSAYSKLKWFPLVGVPFRISKFCCNKMKKDPIHKYQRDNNVAQITALMASESRQRKQNWIRHGCNAFDGTAPKSQPMAFWTEQDVLRYIEFYKVEIPSVYGEIVYKDKDGYAVKAPSYGMIPADAKLETTGASRTGCVYCGFGLQSEKGETRFQRLKRTHPKQYDYCMNGGQWIDNPDFIPDCPEYDGDWKNWNPEKIWIPSKEGLGMGAMFEMANSAMGKEVFRVK